MNHVAHPLSSADISIFQRKSANFVISRNADIDCILKQIFCNKYGYNFDDVNKNGYPRLS